MLPDKGLKKQNQACKKDICLIRKLEGILGVGNGFRTNAGMSTRATNKDSGYNRVETERKIGNLLELTVTWDENIPNAKQLKERRYEELVEECKEQVMMI